MKIAATRPSSGAAESRRQRDQRLRRLGIPPAAQDFALGVQPRDGLRRGQVAGSVRRVSASFRSGNGVGFKPFGRDAGDEADVRADVDATPRRPASSRRTAGRCRRCPCPVARGIFRNTSCLQVERRAVRLQLVPVDLAAAPVAGEQRVAVLLRPARVLHEQPAGAAAAAERAQRRHDLVGEVGEQLRVAVVGRLHQVADARVPAGAVVGVVAGEEVQERVDGDVERVPQPGAVDLQLRAVGPDADDAAAAQRRSFVPSFPLASLMP